MSRKTTWMLLAAAALILAGCILFGGTMMALNWDFTKLSTVKYETSRYEIHEPYENISIAADTAHVTLVPAQNGESTVVCYEKQNAKHTVSVKDGTLVAELCDTGKWYENISISFDAPRITISVPPREYGALSVAVTTGKVTISDMTCTGDVNVSVSTGKVQLTDVQCRNLISNGSTGNLTLKNVAAQESFSLERTTGNVTFDSCDAGEISVKANTGNVRGTLRTEKVFVTETSTGKVSVPGSVTGGRCEVTTTTGDIHLQVQ